MAIKIITPDEDEIPEDLMIEIALLKKCQHPNIIEYFGGYRKGDEIFVSVLGFLKLYFSVGVLFTGLTYFCWYRLLWSFVTAVLVIYSSLKKILY